MRPYLFLLLLLPGCAVAAAPADTIDHKKVQAEYSEGNFEIVIQQLEEYRGKHSAFRAVDSFFLAKYLGVVYASNPNTREKGKYWLYRMLQIDPSAELVDMYVGEEVDHTFEKVRQEFIVRRNYRGINDVKLAKAIKDGEAKKDTVVVVVKDSGAKDEALPDRELKEFRHGWTWNLNLGVGMKFMNPDEWSTRQQTEFRATFDIRQRRWPINIALDYMRSDSKELMYISQATGRPIKYVQGTEELNFGVRKIFDRKLYSMRPFLGGGFGYVSAKIDYKSEFSDFQDGNFGAWMDGGIYWELERHFNVGVEGVWSWATVPVTFGEANAGGLHAQMILGYHW